MQMRKALCLMVVVVVGACSDDSGSGGSGASGAGAAGIAGFGGTGGVAGNVGGTGGGVAGVGGTGGAVGGTGGAVGGTGGGVAGTGGVGGAAPMMAGFLAPGCEAADTTAAPADLHAAAMSVLSNLGETLDNGMPDESPCGFSSCHQGRGKAGLILQDAPDLNALLVGKQSCETATVPLVDGSGGDTALKNSWIWIKMAGNFDASDQNVMIADPAWGMGMNCGQLPSQPHGVHMPQLTSDLLGEDRLGPVRNWICAGAPGPM